MSKKIIVVDDDIDFRSATASLLTREGFNVDEAENGEEAMKLLTPEHEMVLSDVNMPIMDGFELTKEVKEKFKIPVILFSAFYDGQSILTLLDRGADAAISKPFSRKELIELMLDFLTEGKPLNDGKFVAIPINETILHAQIPYSLYIRLNSGRFLKLANCGEDIDRSRLEQLQKKNVTELYLLAEDFDKYKDLQLAKTMKSLDYNNLSIEDKLDLCLQSAQILIDQCKVPGLVDEKIDEAKSFMAAVINGLSTSKSLLNSLVSMANNIGYRYTHSMAVAVYSGLAYRMNKEKSKRDADNLALASLFHDIALSDKIIEKMHSEVKLNEAEKKTVNKHVSQSAKILAKTGEASKEILQLIEQHHENGMGWGPLNMTFKHCHPLTPILSATNDFCSYVLRPEGSLSPEEAISEMERKPAGYYDLAAMNAIKSLVNV